MIGKMCTEPCRKAISRYGTLMVWDLERNWVGGVIVDTGVTLDPTIIIPQTRSEEGGIYYMMTVAAATCIRVPQVRDSAVTVFTPLHEDQVPDSRYWHVWLTAEEMMAEDCLGEIAKHVAAS